MNLQLQRALNNAHNFLLKDEAEYVNKINEIKEEIDILRRVKPKPRTPNERLQKNQILDILLLVFVWPVGLWNIFRNKKEAKKLEQQANEEYIREMHEYNQYIEEIKAKINFKREQLENLKTERTKYYNQYSDCLNFIPKNYQNIHAVGAILGYVENGLADTLKEALIRYVESLKEEEKEWIHQEEQEIRRQQHNENQAALKEIIENQETTNREIARNNDILRTASERYFHTRY